MCGSPLTNNIRFSRSAVFISPLPVRIVNQLHRPRPLQMDFLRPSIPLIFLDFDSRQLGNILNRKSYITFVIALQGRFHIRFRKRLRWRNVVSLPFQSLSDDDLDLVNAAQGIWRDDEDPNLLK